MEYRRFAPGESFVSTFEYHKDRERAPHLEQAIHRWRLEAAADFVSFYVSLQIQSMPGYAVTVTDLGCGDGGLLSLLQSRHQSSELVAFGVDFQPSNADGWRERGVNARAGNFVDDFDELISWRTDLFVMTEVLEHLEDPHGMLRKIRELDAAVVCSSPYVEGIGNIDASHNWAWDVPGYMKMLHDAGFASKRFVMDSHFQVHLALPDHCR